MLGPIGVAGVDAEDQVAEVGVDHAGDRPRPERPRLFERKRRRKAVTVLRRIGKDLPAAVAAIARGRTEERARGRLIEVVERLHRADREPGELDERTVRVEAGGRSVRAVVVHTDLEVAAKGPVLGLLAAVEPRIGAGAHDEVATVGPVPEAGAIACRVARAGGALTGSSAACAPATATSPAAVPRRRLFTIFISTRFTRNLLYEKSTRCDRRQATTARHFKHSAVSFRPGVAETTLRSR